MDAAEALTRLGGSSEAGRFALPTASDARLAAARLSGVVCLRSAAAHHGWGLKTQPELPEVAVPRNRKVTADRRTGVDLHWMALGEDDTHAGVTSPLRTVLDCARHLPFDEALAVADSALRSGVVTRGELDALAVRGPGSAAVRRVLRHADGRAANPFESVLRAMCLDAGLVVEPQAPVDLGTGVVHPDVVCHGELAVFEGDSWTHHSTRSAHKRDCARYNLLVLAGWRVFRFTWEQVMLEPAYVRWVLGQVARRVGHAEVPSAERRPA